MQSGQICVSLQILCVSTWLQSSNSSLFQRNLPSRLTLKTNALHLLPSTVLAGRGSCLPGLSLRTPHPLLGAGCCLLAQKHTELFEMLGKALGCQGQAPTCSTWREVQHYYWLQRQWDSAPGWKLAPTLIELREGDSLRRTATSWAMGWDLYWTQLQQD